MSLETKTMFCVNISRRQFLSSFEDTIYVEALDIKDAIEVALEYMTENELEKGSCINSVKKINDFYRRL